MHKNAIKDVLLTSLFLASVGLNLAQMRELERRRRSSDARINLPIGSPAIRISAYNLDGRPAVIEYARDVPTIIYVFSPRCGWCTRNLANVAALAAQTSQRYRLIGLSISDEGLQEYVRQQGWSFPVYSKPAAEAVAHFRLQSTPQTILISSEGRVLHSWTGAYANDTLNDIERTLRVRLPGIGK